MNAALEKEALKNRNVIPGGMFYCEIADPTIEPKYELSEEELEREVLLKFKPKGLVNSEEDIYCNVGIDITDEDIARDERLINLTNEEFISIVAQIRLSNGDGIL